MQFTQRMSGPFTTPEGQSKIAINNVELIDTRYTIQNPPQPGVKTFVEDITLETGVKFWVWGHSDKPGALAWEQRCLARGLVHTDAVTCKRFVESRYMQQLPLTQREAKRAEWAALRNSV